MRQFNCYFWICLIALVFYCNANPLSQKPLSEPESNKNVKVNVNLNFSIENTGNSIGEMSVSNSFELKQKPLSSSKESKINKNLDEKITMENNKDNESDNMKNHEGSTGTTKGIFVAWPPANKGKSNITVPVSLHKYKKSKPIVTDLEDDAISMTLMG